MNLLHRNSRAAGLTAVTLLAVSAYSTSPAAAVHPSHCFANGVELTPHPFAGLTQPAAAPDELLALVEIPAGSAVKYDLHHPSGRMVVDRFLTMPMAYPINYGVLPCTLAGDGDALDILVLTRAPLAPGSVIRVRPIGVLRMLDRGEEDHKILAVPLSSVDATYDGIAAATDLPPDELARIEAFFGVYKELPHPPAEVQGGPWEGPAAALTLVRSAMATAAAPTLHD
ncbi:MAG: inorganic diphosphatase [Gemmatimonadota bacterium]